MTSTTSLHPAPEPLFCADTLSVARGDRLVIDQLSFTLSAGQAMVITGPNGVGKSSLMRALGGFLPPISGHILVDGSPFKPDDPDCLLPLVWYAGADGLSEQLSAQEALDVMHMLRGHARQKHSEAKDPFFISEFLHKPVRHLSTGQRQRLALSGIISVSSCSVVPPLWLLDEPDSGLDSEGRLVLEEQISAHLDNGGRLIMVSHQSRAPRFPHSKLVLGASS